MEAVIRMLDRIANALEEQNRFNHAVMSGMQAAEEDDKNAKEAISVEPVRPTSIIL